MTTPAPVRPPRFDCHVHLVGNGTGGTGCRVSVPGLHRLLIPVMLRTVGLDGAAFRGDLDELFVQQIAKYAADSSLDYVVVLANDETYDSSGRMREGFAAAYTPNSFVLAQAKRFPQFVPAASIHPARADALEELERCLAGGAAMLKLLPNCHHVDYDEPKYTRFFERMAEAGMPLLSHTGGEHTLPQTDPALCNPAKLKRVLEIGVTAIAAHSGTKSGLFDPEWFHVWAEMTRRFPNLYGDNSALLSPTRGRHLPKLAQAPLSERCLHGSDLPVAVQPIWPLLRRQISVADWRRTRALPNPLERDYRIKKAMGFPEEVFTRLGTLLAKRGTYVARAGRE